MQHSRHSAQSSTVAGFQPLTLGAPLPCLLPPPSLHPAATLSLRTSEPPLEATVGLLPACPLLLLLHPRPHPLHPMSLGPAPGANCLPTQPGPQGLPCQQGLAYTEMPPKGLALQTAPALGSDSSPQAAGLPSMSPEWIGAARPTPHSDRCLTAMSAPSRPPPLLLVQDSASRPPRKSAPICPSHTPAFLPPPATAVYQTSPRSCSLCPLLCLHTR